MKWLKKLLTNNTGFSVKSLFCFSTMVIGCLLLLCVGGILVYDCAIDGRIDTDLMGLSALVGSIVGVLGAGGLTKAIGEKK